MNDILFFKIKSNTKAYQEFSLFIDKLSTAESLCKKNIKESLSCRKNQVSNLKVNTETLKKLFSLKKELEWSFVAETVTTLLDYYNYDKIISRLSKIKIYNIPRMLEKT